MDYHMFLISIQYMRKEFLYFFVRGKIKCNWKSNFSERKTIFNFFPFGGGNKMQLKKFFSKQKAVSNFPEKKIKYNWDKNFSK